MFCVLLKLFSGLFLILVIVGKLQIAECNKKLGNVETYIEQLKEIRKVEEANMFDSCTKLCLGQYSSVSVNDFVLQYCFNFYLCYAVIRELGGIHVDRGDLCEALTCCKEALELYQQEDHSDHVKIADSLITFLTQHDIILKVVCFLFSSRVYWCNIL